MARVSLLSASVVVFVAAGCAAKPTMIVSEPPGAFIKVDGANKGSSPVEHTFDFKRKGTYVVQGTLARYLPTEVVVTREDMPASGALKIALEPDDAWAATTTSEATNRWLRIHVNPAFKSEDMWRRIVDSVMTRYSTIEQMDPVSGHIRSAAEIQRFQRSGDLFLVRTQIVGTISSDEPLVYRLKIISESSADGIRWSPYDRIFRADAQLIEDLQNRLSVR